PCSATPTRRTPTTRPTRTRRACSSSAKPSTPSASSSTPPDELVAAPSSSGCSPRSPPRWSPVGSRYLTDLADVLRSAGLVVHEEPGWQTRARGSGGYDSGRPTHVMVHHTASNPGSDPDGDVAYIARNAADAPLANLYLSRSGDVHVIAAGATNTNG